MYVLVIAVLLCFGVLLHGMARHRDRNGLLWSSLGASLWFLPIPLLLLIGRRETKNLE